MLTCMFPVFQDIRKEWEKQPRCWQSSPGGIAQEVRFVSCHFESSPKGSGLGAYGCLELWESKQGTKASRILPVAWLRLSSMIGLVSRNDHLLRFWAVTHAISRSRVLRYFMDTKLAIFRCYSFMIYLKHHRPS